MITLKTPDQVGARRAHPGGNPQKYVLDDRGRRLIEDCYDGSRERCNELARWLGVPPGAIKKWAQKLGVSRNSDPRWTQEEIEYLEKNLLKMTSKDIAKRLGRTVIAVQAKALRLNLYKSNLDGYTKADLALGLGIRDHHKIEKWIDRGWIKGKKLPISEYATRQPWVFTAKAIRDFIIAHPGEIDLRRVEKVWFIDIMAGGDGIGALG